MRKNYVFILILFLFVAITSKSFAQDSSISTGKSIEGLAVYPNPVTNGKTFVYITSNNKFIKQIDIFNVLGKLVFSTRLTGKELNISALNKGVYVLKITENSISETRKLVIK